MLNLRDGLKMKLKTLTMLFCLLTSSVFSQTLTSLSPSSGSTGNSITLNGTNLGNTINVFFGTAASRISSISSTQVVVTVPSSLGGGSYSVYASTGYVNSNSLVFFVGNTFTPTFTPTQTYTPTGSPTPTFTPTNTFTYTPLPVNNQGFAQLGNGYIVVSPTWTPVPTVVVAPVSTIYLSGTGTFTTPANALWLRGLVIGGGNKGANTDSTAGGGGGGGGGSGANFSFELIATPGATYSYQVGSQATPSFFGPVTCGAGVVGGTNAGTGPGGGGAGGTYSTGAQAITISASAGSAGAPGGGGVAGFYVGPGGVGGNSCLGGCGSGGTGGGGAGGSGATNSGAGGGGAGGTSGTGGSGASGLVSIQIGFQ